MTDARENEGRGAGPRGDNLDQHWWEEESGETDILAAVTLLNLLNFGKKTQLPK